MNAVYFGFQMALNKTFLMCNQSSSMITKCRIFKLVRDYSTKYSTLFYHQRYSSKIFNLPHHAFQLSRTLAEVGKLETPKLQGKYATGQLFLHQVFGYRGVILFPWVYHQHSKSF